MAALNPKKKSQQSLQNVKVVVRVRPLTKSEQEQNVKSILKCHTHREIVMRDKKYLFDRVFKAVSTQVELYSIAVAPLIRDVVAGYNCTVFAYGQTGTGKTYTMTGDKCTPVLNWKEDLDAGIIPRAAFHIFDELEKMSNSEINVKVSYMELYNEEIRDLLSNDEGSLQLFNDTKGGLTVHGLTETSVRNSEDICQLLQCGILKRQTAPTLMNHQSSRSHTVFTITVHTTDRTSSGNEVLKLGKINLVDLAGSENIARSGCKDLRAQELANINKSLLTLGRVIHALADKSQRHVPYRDSKLTRILQDSLGGHTKTVIIATVSPGQTSQEETASTLDYASRARDIKNTPLVNEKLSKNEMIMDLVKEIDRLQKDLDAARSGTGFYVDKENYQRIMDAIAAVTGEQITPEELAIRKAERIKSLEQHLTNRVREFEETVEQCKKHQAELENAKQAIKEKEQNLETERFLSKWYEQHSSEACMEAQNLLKAAHTLSSEKEILLAKLEQQFNINVKHGSTAQNTVRHVLDMIHKCSVEETQLMNVLVGRDLSLNDHVKKLKEFLESTIKEMENIEGSIDKEHLESFSVHRTLGVSTKNTISFMKRKIAELKELSNDNWQEIQTYRAVLPSLAETHKERTEWLLESATGSLETQYSHCLNNSKVVKNKMEDYMNHVRVMRIKEEESLKQLEHLVQITKEKIQSQMTVENSLDEASSEISDFVKRSTENVETSVDYLGQIAKESIKMVDDLVTSCGTPCTDKCEEFVELAERVNNFEDELDAATRNLDCTYNMVTQDILRSVRNFTDQKGVLFRETAEQKINSVLEDMESIKKSSSSFDQQYRTCFGNIESILVEQILDQSVLPQHIGDTPARNKVEYPTRLKEIAPREALINKFRMALPKTNENVDSDADDDENDIFHDA